MNAAIDLPRVLDLHAKWLQGGPGGQRADLWGAYLVGADLGGADLRDAYLGGADFGGAFLVGADLSGADLSGADLRDANLGGADLRGADLRRVNLRRADLGGAYLGGADLEGTVLPDGWAWWQGGAYGPRRRMIRVLRGPDTLTVYAGCLAGTPDDVIRWLTVDRHPVWVDEIGQDAADRAIARAVRLIDMGVQSTAYDVGPVA